MTVMIKNAEHVFVTSEGYWLESYKYNRDILVVTFEHAGGGPRRPDALRHGWSSRFFRARGISHLSVKPEYVDWYQGPGLEKAFIALRSQGYFDQFDRIMTYGSSMGGHAALAYANVVGATEVVALNPQSAIGTRAAPWERRFNKHLINLGMPEGGKFADTKGRFSRAERVVVSFDPHIKPDLRHIRRIMSDKIETISVPYLGHSSVTWLNNFGQLKNLLFSVINGVPIDHRSIRLAMRQRRKCEHYYQELLKKPRVRSSRVFTAAVQRGLQSITSGDE